MSTVKKSAFETALRARLDGVMEQERLWVTREIDSTNAEAKRRAAQGAPAGTVILAEGQTAGRGRLGRSFYSPNQGGVYASVLLRPALPMEDVVQVTVAASVAAARAVETVTGRYPAIKWVNDLYLDGKKICGILAESVFDPQNGAFAGVVIGVGINCGAVFPRELEGIAGNISLPGIADRAKLAAELVSGLLVLEEWIATGQVMEEYRAHSMVLGREVTLLQEGDALYRVEEIDPCGALILRDENGGERILASGEISLRLADATKSLGEEMGV